MGQVGGLAKKSQSYPLGEASRKIILNFKTRNVGGCFCQKLPHKFQSYPVGRASTKIMLNFENTIRRWLFLSKNWISKEFKSKSCANHLSTRASEPSKQTIETNSSWRSKPNLADGGKSGKQANIPVSTAKKKNRAKPSQTAKDQGKAIELTGMPSIPKR